MELLTMKRLGIVLTACGLMNSAAHGAEATSGADLRTPVLESQSVFPKIALDLLGVNPVLALVADGRQIASSEAASVSSLVREAIDYSLEYRAATESAMASKYSAEVAFRALLPRVDVTVGTGANLYRTTTQPNTTTLNRTDATLMARQSLWDPALRAEVGRKESLRKASDFDSEGAGLRVSAELIAAYLEVVRNRATVDITNDYESTLKRLIDYLRKRADAGATSQADLDRVRGREEGAKSRALEARAGMAAAGFALRRQLGRVPDAISLPASVDMKLPGDIETAFNEASAASPDLKAARAQLEALGYEYKALRGRFLPKFELELSNARSQNASGTPGRTNDLKAMVMMSMSLFASGADDLEMKASAERRAALFSRSMHAERVLKQDLEVAYSTVDAIRQRMEPAVKELEANMRVAKTYDEQLLLGGRTLLDLLDAYQRLYESRLGLLQLVVVDAQQKYNLVRLLGRLEQLRSGV